MTTEILLQAFALPLAVLLVAAFSRQWLLVPVAIGFWIDAIWIKGTRFVAMDSIALALTLSTLAVYGFERMKRPVWLSVYLTLAVLLSWWQVKNFAGNIPVTGWILQLVILVLVILAPLMAADQKKTDFLSLLWLVPAGFVGVLSPIAASVMIGQFGGLIATFGAGLWLLSWRGQLSIRQLAIWIMLPTLFAAQMAWHYAEIDWKALILGMLALVPLVALRQHRLRWWQQLVVVAVVAAIIFSTGLWMEWPEQSLY